MSDALQKRIDELEDLIRDFPTYIDNWDWFYENRVLLRTISDLPYAQRLEE